MDRTLIRPTTLKSASNGIGKLFEALDRQIGAIEKAIARIIESDDD